MKADNKVSIRDEINDELNSQVTCMNPKARILLEMDGRVELPNDIFSIDDLEKIIAACKRVLLLHGDGWVIDEFRRAFLDNRGEFVVRDDRLPGNHLRRATQEEEDLVDSFDIA